MFLILVLVLGLVLLKTLENSALAFILVLVFGLVLLKTLKNSALLIDDVVAVTIGFI